MADLENILFTKTPLMLDASFPIIPNADFTAISEPCHAQPLVKPYRQKS
jgi:hypothetical protein